MTWTVSCHFLFTLYLSSPVWFLVLGFISSLLMCQTRRHPCSQKWQGRFPRWYLIFPMCPSEVKCGVPLSLTDQLCPHVTTSRRAELPSRVRPRHITIWLRGKPSKSQTLIPSGSTFFFFHGLSHGGISSYLQHCRNYLM